MSAEIAYEIAAPTRRNARLRALLTPAAAGAAKICAEQAEILRAAAAELGRVRTGATWFALDDLLGRARNMDSIVAQMIDALDAPNAASAAWDAADRTLT